MNTKATFETKLLYLASGIPSITSTYLEFEKSYRHCPKNTQRIMVRVRGAFLKDFSGLKG
mgnify:CR=1 FL=1